MSSTSERKTLEAIALALRIERSSNEMAPCSYCRRHKRRYIAVEPLPGETISTRCAKCVRYRRPKCDYTFKLPSSRNWESIDK